MSYALTLLVKLNQITRHTFTKPPTREAVDISTKRVYDEGLGVTNNGSIPVFHSTGSRFHRDEGKTGS